jgi:hypothetical protein
MLDIINELWRDGSSSSDLNYIDIYNLEELNKYIIFRKENLRLYISFQFSTLSREARELINSNRYCVSNWDVSKCY